MAASVAAAPRKAPPKGPEINGSRVKMPMNPLNAEGAESGLESRPGVGISCVAHPSGA